MSMHIRLTPTGQLRWEAPEDGTAAAALAPLGKAFQADWREGLFTLAADKLSLDEAPTVRYWQALAQRYLTSLCHIPGTAETFAVAAPSRAECASLVLTAPPMQGGEYLSAEVLHNIWEALDSWSHEAVAATGGLTAFLQTRAPKWHQVGRVGFHLAENKPDAARPFAFMATYTAGFGAAGRLQHLPLRKALEQYAGAQNRPALINLLSPVHQAAERCAWVQQMVDSGEIYQPMAWSVRRAYAFLQSVPALEESGIAVRLPNWWQTRPRPQVSVKIGTQAPAMFGADAMLDFDVDLALGDAALSAEELQTLLASTEPLVLLKGQWVVVDRDKLREAMAHWEALRRQAKNGQISFIEGMRLLAGASADLQHEAQAEAERPWVHVAAGEAMRQLLARLRQPGALDGVEAELGLQGTLRPYQRQGVAWLRLLTQLGLGACLADDMGLGKTIQVLALLLCLRHETSGAQHAPSLLVIPASLLGNWQNEAARFAPSLKLVCLHPAATDQRTLAQIAAAPATHLADADLVITTYAMLSRQSWLAEQTWRLVILDEAQAIKNPGTRQSKATKKLSAQARITLTGTPVENRLGDLWSLFDFLNPGLLGSTTVFQAFVKNLQARQHNQFAPLRQLVAPYILRRLKTDRAIIADLPDKTETPRYCHLTRPQIQLYEHIVRELHTALASVDGMARRGLVLQTLLRLKQLCNHPSQLSGDGAYRPADSGKFLRLAEIGDELAARQEKVLIFTQFREIIDPLAAHLAMVFGRSGVVLHGGTSVQRRQALVEQFQRDDGPPFFILSLRAGGTGLNLTAASHVIHFDRWWNPAVENQATDRAFRIGQRRNVLVHKFITSGTIEERIDTMLAQKQQFADDILASDSEVNLTELPDEELLRLVRLDVTRAAG
jgi:non-specific serine/threonine protein kinase